MVLAGCYIGQHEPHLLIESHLVNGELVVQGTTDLPDGALLQYNVWHARDDIEGDYGELSVSDGRFDFKTDVSRWPAGEVKVQVAFSAGPFQPEPVIAEFGVHGEKLGGPHVEDDSGRPTMKVLEITDLPAS